MGWYGDLEKKCPNCKKENAVALEHNDLRGPLFLACPDCGFLMHCNTSVYKIKGSYFNNNIIGRDPRKLLDEIDNIIDINVSTNIIEQEDY